MRSRARATSYPASSPAVLPVPSLEEDLAARLARGEEVILATVIKLAGEPPSRTGAQDLVRALEVLLPRNPRFIGLVGSRRHTGHHLEALRAKGVDDAVIARIQSPVGLDIGALTPAEIALSILAGLIAKRRDRQGGWLYNRD